MKVHVARAYLDLARGVINTRIYDNPDAQNAEDALFALMSCTYVYSYMSLTAFVSSYLHKEWNREHSALKTKYEGAETFEALMAGPLREIKKALNELSAQYGIEKLAKVRPTQWQQLNEFIKAYRDYFIHPDPEHFHDYVIAIGQKNWEFPSAVAAGIMASYFELLKRPVPKWLEKGGLVCRGFDYVGT